MAGTVNGGRKAARTNISKYGKDFYARIGAMGGRLGHTGGFYSNRDLARKAGRMGGLKSRRGPSRTGRISRSRKS
jgi:general stress protein YciG